MTSPEIWGSHFWKTLEFITTTYPKNPTTEDIQNYKSFFILFGKVLPCNQCSINYENHLDLFSLEKSLNSRQELIKFLIDLHNKVNKMNNKKVLSYEEAIEKINKNIKTIKYTKYHLILITLLLIFLIYVLLNLKYFKKLFF